MLIRRETMQTKHW